MATVTAPPPLKPRASGEKQKSHHAHRKETGRPILPVSADRWNRDCQLLLVENALQTGLVLCGLERQHEEQPGFLGGEIVGEHGTCFLECLAAADVAIVRQHPPVGDTCGNDYGGVSVRPDAS